MSITIVVDTPLGRLYHAPMLSIASRFSSTVLPLVIFLPGICSAGSGGGTTSFSFLNIVPGARQAAMGGAASAKAGDVNGLYWNPASLARLTDVNATISYADYFRDVQFGFVGYARPLSGGHVVGVGVQYLSYGTFRETSRSDPTGALGRTFGASDVAVTLSYSRPVSEFIAFGVNAKTAYERIKDFSATALAADAGILIRVPRTRLTGALVIRQAGFAVGGFTDESESQLPVEIRMGLSYVPRHLPLTLLMDLEKTRGQDPAGQLGGEFSIRDLVFIRMGYSTSGTDRRVESSDSHLTGSSAGIGFQSRSYRLDYGFTPGSRLGDIHRFSLSCHF